MTDKEKYLKDKGITTKFNNLEEQNPNLWDELCKIADHFNKQKSYMKGTIQSFIEDIGQSEHIHSIRYRIKDTDSLLVKIVKKKYDNVTPDSKYSNVTVDNYYKIITDLIGVRIIIRYRHEWQYIHKLIWDKFFKDEKNYIEDYERDYFSGKDIFIAEKPIVYYRTGEQKKEYEVFGRDTFSIKLSDIGYSSIHYIINVNGTYIELQVRTIYDEAWSECDHDFVYKLNACPKKLVLQRCSKMLSDLTGVADTLSTFIKDYHNDQIYEQLSDNEELSSVIEPIISEKTEITPQRIVGVGINKVSDVFDMF